MLNTRYEPWGSCVFLIATNHEVMSSDANNLGCWANRELYFAIPVKCYRGDDLVSLALVDPFVFTDSNTAAITGREVNGRPTVEGAIVSPSDTWMTDAGPAQGDRNLLRLHTLVFPALGLGQPAVRRRVVDIYQGLPLPQNDEVRWRMVADDWGHDLLAYHRATVNKHKDNEAEFLNLKALAVELLGNRQPINNLTLKQFRDSDQPNSACYQGVIQSSVVIEKVYDLQEIEDPIHVGIHRYPSQPIVEILGLKAKWVDETGPSVVDVLQPLRPFWMKVAIRTSLGREIGRRSESREWEGLLPMELYFQGEGRTRVGPSLAQEVDEKKRGIRAMAREWLDRAADGERLSRSDAATAVERIEPHMVLESILTQEWEHWGDARWYKRQEAAKRGHEGPPDKSDLCFRGDSAHIKGVDVWGQNRGWYSAQEAKAEPKRSE